MQWKQFLTPVQSIDSSAAHKLIAAHDKSDLVLLDVRQPTEYNLQHLPGSRLIPLPRLNDRMGELDPDTTIIVY